MVSERVWLGMNVSLGIIALFLVLTLFNVPLPTVGKAKLLLDTRAPLCIVQYGDEITPWQDIDRCCLEARKQLKCVRKDNDFTFGQADYMCQTGSGKTLQYHINAKAYNYCQQQVFW